MRNLMWKCEVCQRYTLHRTCPTCGSLTRNPHPPKFSPEDRFGKYRRMWKRDMLWKEV
ncbi:RNA-protein complex protein Nop10 [Thermococci archaeon]|nr:MAG: RNA-protein complex protein Nop10 [Thermococci archaeon]RLF94070.1 MAG: RNA-protein complex protein Nop10 [Thermococci archaeon]